MIFPSISAVLNIFLLMGIGFVLTKAKWITPDNRSLLTKLVVYLAVPCTIFNNMLSAITPESLKTAGEMLIVPAITVVSTYLFGLFVARYVLKMPKNRHRTFAAMSGCPNTIFVGVPIVMALFGDAGVPAAMFFFVCQTSLFWSVGASGIQSDGQGKAQFSVGTMLKKIFSLNVIVILVVVALVLLRIQPPTLVTNITKYIGNLSTPLSLFFSGNALCEIYTEFGFRGLRIQRDVWAVMLARFVIQPVVAFLLCLLFGVTGLTRTVFILMSGMPVMTQTVILSGNYGADRNYAALSFFWTTCASMIVIPVFLLILG